MAKIIVKKSDIPKYAQKSIKNFSKLTKNQAIYEYEMLKLKRRAGKEFGAFLSGFLSRPDKVTKKAIEALKSLKGKKLQEEKSSYEREKRTIRMARQMEREDYNFSFDLEEEAAEEMEYSAVADMEELADEFISELYQEIFNAQSSAEISSSSYRSGRSKSLKSRMWLQDNIQRGTDLLIRAIQQRTATRESKIAFYKELSQYSLSDLQDAVSEYLAGLYRVTAVNVTGYLQVSRIYSIINSNPVSLYDAEEMEDL